MGGAAVIVELRQNTALVRFDAGGSEWIRAAVIELLDDSVLADR